MLLRRRLHVRIVLSGACSAKVRFGSLAVIAEVLISDQCGIAADVTIHNGTVLPLHAPLEKWVQECNRWLNNRDQPSGFERPWAKVAQEYVAQYEKLLALKKDK